MSERPAPPENEPQHDYEAPSVEEVDTLDEPAVTVAGLTRS